MKFSHKDFLVQKPRKIFSAFLYPIFFWILTRYYIWKIQTTIVRLLNKGWVKKQDRHYSWLLIKLFSFSSDFDETLWHIVLITTKMFFQYWMKIKKFLLMDHLFLDIIFLAHPIYAIYMYMMTQYINAKANTINPSFLSWGKKTSSIEEI